jgi:Fur family ferric uptake transcriptional regulator
MNPTAAILKNNNLHVTAARLAILSLFIQEKCSLTSREIENRIGESLGRVTIYRTLQVFLNRGILHCVPTAQPFALYHFPGDSAGCCNHVHFICESCGRAFHLKDVVLPVLHLPDHFRATRSDLIIRGQCGCRRKAR